MLLNRIEAVFSILAAERCCTIKKDINTVVTDIAITVEYIIYSGTNNVVS